ncbi:helix-turn-helix domain-containing protein [Geobacillus sp. C56-T2]|uniref:helix-turn-helix domain-containing protein n=1 Tax=Geobacillus sp. C56-T2 TaxID=600773 RepID=UPI00119CAD67|nr:helix-turn-helix domain-containing protein [Geobacillus sp. C56-T2]
MSSAEFKMDIVHKYLHEGWSQSDLLKHFHIHNSMLQRWVNQYQREGIKGLKEKQGKTIGTNKGRLRKNPSSPEEKMKRLEAENAYLKKLLAVRKGVDTTKEKSLVFTIIHE